jgi:hypothetical protein
MTLAQTIAEFWRYDKLAGLWFFLPLRWVRSRQDGKLRVFVMVPKWEGKSFYMRSVNKWR